MLAGIPKTVPAQTVNRLCGSSMQALHTASANIMANQGDIYLIGGVEHMTHVPMTHGFDLNPKASKSYAKASNMMGLTAEMLGSKFEISRAEQDEFALNSHLKASDATKNGRFASEIVAIQGHDEAGNVQMCTVDEVIRFDANIESLQKLKPVFDPINGTVTAGSSSALSDGASAMLIML